MKKLVILLLACSFSSHAFQNYLPRCHVANEGEIYQQVSMAGVEPVTLVCSSYSIGGTIFYGWLGR